MPDKPKTVAELLHSISDSVEDLQAATGVNRRAVILLLAHHTKLPQKTIRAVLDGAVEALEAFVDPEETS